jgi:hypothetical protein
MSAVPEHVTAATLAEVLLADAIDPCIQAAVGLLAVHNGYGRWLADSGFRASCVVWGEPDDENPTPGAHIVWRAVLEFLQLGPGPASGSEVAVLEVAYSIARGALCSAANRCDRQNWAAIVAAVISIRSEA